MIFGSDRDQLRRFFIEAWARHRERRPLDPLSAQIVEVVEVHPEYQPLLIEPETALGVEFTPEQSRTNPFLHMSLHIALREQATTDRPPGIATIHHRLTASLGRHEAEHEMLECLGEALWQAQRSGQLPDEAAYLECLRRLAGRC